MSRLVQRSRIKLPASEGLLRTPNTRSLSFAAGLKRREESYIAKSDMLMLLDAGAARLRQPRPVWKELALELEGVTWCGLAVPSSGAAIPLCASGNAAARFMVLEGRLLESPDAGQASTGFQRA